jgi:ribosomal protein L23
MKANKSWNIETLADNYKKRLEFEKYMCPGGLKPTITSRFAKPPTEIEFVSHTMTLSRSEKKYGNNTICFRTNDFLSKPEIKQYFQKLYNLRINRIATARHQGEIKRNHDNTKWRKSDFKKVMLRLDYEVDPELQKNI